MGSKIEHKMEGKKKKQTEQAMVFSHEFARSLFFFSSQDKQFGVHKIKTKNKKKEKNFFKPNVKKIVFLSLSLSLSTLIIIFWNFFIIFNFVLQTCDFKQNHYNSHLQLFYLFIYLLDAIFEIILNQEFIYGICENLTKYNAEVA